MILIGCDCRGTPGKSAYCELMDSGRCFPANRGQRAALVTSSLIACGCTGILQLFDRRPFQPYLGDLNPLLAVALMALLGTAALGFLYARGWLIYYLYWHILWGHVRLYVLFS